MNSCIKSIAFPSSVRLEASTICQLKCSSCITGSGEIHHKLGAGFLKFKDFKDFIDRYPQIERIELSNWGEIFLNKDLLKLVHYAHTKAVSLSARNGVNLNYVSEEVLKALVQYRFRALSCSLDGASQATYAAYRIGGNFDRVIGNIKRINYYKRLLKRPFPMLIWQFVAFGHNEHEIAKAKKMAASLNMRFHLKLNWEGLHTENNLSPIINKELVRKESGLGAANRDEFREKYGREYSQGSCMHLWTNPQINYDGRVLGCSVNYWDDYGNAFLTALGECLNSEKIRIARRILTGTGTAGYHIPCYECKNYNMMVKHETWIRKEEIDKISKQFHKMRLKSKIRRYRVCRKILNFIYYFKIRHTSPEKLIH